MKGSKVISIIVPSYNMEKYLEKCLNSLLINSIGLLDVIIVNDGSKDTTLEIARKYEKKYPESFHVIDKVNGNYGSCINVALKVATGRYIKVLDADDSFDVSNFELFVKTIADIDCDLIISDYVTVDEKGNEMSLWRMVNVPPKQILAFDEQQMSNLDGRFQMHAVTYRTEILKKIQYVQMEGIPYTDNQWMFLPMTEVRKFCYINIQIYKYLIGRIGQTVSSDSYVKNSDALLALAHKMVSDYLVIKYDNLYLKSRLTDIITRLYYIFLFRKSDFRSNQEIALFDKMLESEIPEIHRDLDKKKLLFMPFYFIKHWRKNKYDNNTRIYRLLRGMFNLKKRLSH